MAHYRFCPKCGRLIVRPIKRNQRYCNSCIINSEPDLVVNIGNFHAEVRTELVGTRAFKHWMNVLRDYSKQVTKESKKSNESNST